MAPGCRCYEPQIFKHSGTKPASGAVDSIVKRLKIKQNQKGSMNGISSYR